MRRSLLVLMIFLLVLCCVMPVSAAIGASDLGSHNTVNRDGSCQVTMTMTLHLDEARNDLEFPVPGDAASVTVNGSRVRTAAAGDYRTVDLDKALGRITGDVSLSITYNLPDVIHTAEGGSLELRIPLLCGFVYPISDMEFTVTLPGGIETLPSFESGYHQANIERDLSYSVEGATITGVFTAELKDHETVTMKLRVSEKMFPQTLANTQDYTFGLIAMAVCGGLALVYWLLTLRVWPFRRIRSTEPLQGCTAGEIGCVLNQQGVNLHLTVLSWARLGYLLVQVDRKGKVILHKRMDMGNERKEGEQRLFKKLFAKRNVVDTTSMHYAILTQYAQKNPMGMHERMHPRAGNSKVFRGLAAGIGLFGGVSLAVAMSSGAILQGLLIIVLGALGALSGWYVQKWGQYLLTPNRHRLILCLSVCGIWLLLSLLTGAFTVGLSMVLGLLAAGLLYAWSGRRTDLGIETMAQTLGLRKYMRSAEKLLLQRLQAMDPDYFFAMAPYALALGVDKSFAKRFGGIRLQDCPYMHTGKDTPLTAADWMVRLRSAVESMDERSRQLPMEKLLKMIQSLRR